MFRPVTYSLTPFEKLHTLVEHTSAFNLDRCQLNIYETNEVKHDYRLKFGGFTITSMLRGKKKITLGDAPRRDYLPGNTVIAPCNSLLQIDFPEASPTSPTQCTAVVIDNDYLNKQVAFFNEHSAQQDMPTNWQFDYNPVLLDNNRELAFLNGQIVNTFTGTDPFKDVHADLLLKDLILCVLRLQNLSRLETNETKGNPFWAVLDYIRTHLTSNIKIEELCRLACMSKSAFYRAFTHEFGIAPNQLIIRERLKLSKQLMVQEKLSVKEAGYAAGFSDPNYFVRTFRKNEGITPGSFIKSN
jgi:AraC-like DNA-binding protein